MGLTPFDLLQDLVREHTEIFWSLFAVDMDDALECQPPDTWDSFSLFQLLNNYLRIESPLRNGKFHRHLTEKFAPLIVRYIDLMESSIARSVDKGFLKVRTALCIMIPDTRYHVNMSGGQKLNPANPMILVYFYFLPFWHPVAGHPLKL